jgi:serine/threonine-protein kinase
MADHEPLARNEPLGREYILHEEIGRGALAVVRRATSRFGGPPLAAKLLRPEYAGDRQVRDVFIREEAALRDLEHPSIVAIHDLVVERGRVALIMDYVDGPDLRRHLAERGGGLPAAEAAAIAAQVAGALAAAHTRGVVHLDLKPENILLVRGADPPVALISDFGVAAMFLDADRGGRPADMTPGYTAPEVLRGGPATTAADVYSLGVVLVEMLTGAPPGAGAMASLPEPLGGLARDCLADDPLSRPPARVLAARLRAAGQESVAAVVSAGPPAVPTSADDRPRAGQPETPLRRGFAPPVPESAEPAPSRPVRWRRGPLITLAAGVVVAAVLIGLNVYAAAGDRTGRVAAIVITTTAAPATTASAQAPIVLPPTTAVAASTPADHTRATFAGHVENDGGTLAISLRDGVAIAYICDGNRLEAWLKGTAAAGKLSLTGKKGAKISGTFEAGRARGTVTADGRTNDFSIGIAKKPSGLYRTAAKVRNAEVVGSWIVLQDGRQVGVLTEDGAPGPAPALDVAGRRTMVDGAEVAATTIDVDTGEGF